MENIKTFNRLQIYETNVYVCERLSIFMHAFTRKYKYAYIYVYVLVHVCMSRLYVIVFSLGCTWTFIFIVTCTYMLHMYLSIRKKYLFNFTRLFFLKLAYAKSFTSYFLIVVNNFKVLYISWYSIRIFSIFDKY